MILGDLGATVMRGVAAGFAVAAPVGPIGILCIRRSLAQGPAIGIASGIGAAAADAAYGLVAALGMTALTAILLGNASLLRIGGGLLMIGLGWSAWQKARLALAGTQGEAEAAVETGNSARGLLSAFGSAFALTLTNPMTILSFIGMMGALVVHSEGAGVAVSGLALVAGVFAGSVSWWLLLVTGVTVARRTVSRRAMGLIEVLSGGALVAFGLRALAQGLY